MKLMEEIFASFPQPGMRHFFLARRAERSLRKESGHERTFFTPLSGMSSRLGAPGELNLRGLPGPAGSAIRHGVRAGDIYARKYCEASGKFVALRGTPPAAGGLPARFAGGHDAAGDGATIGSAPGRAAAVLEK